MKITLKKSSKGDFYHDLSCGTGLSICALTLEQIFPHIIKVPNGKPITLTYGAARKGSVKVKVIAEGASPHCRLVNIHGEEYYIPVMQDRNTIGDFLPPPGKTTYVSVEKLDEAD